MRGARRSPTCRRRDGSCWRCAAGRWRSPGRRARGPLGLGTELESVRDYLPDDDIRQVNWRATARLGRPMSNQYRIEQDRDVRCPRSTRAADGRAAGRTDAARPRAGRDDRSRDRRRARRSVRGVAFDDEVRDVAPARRRARRRSGRRFDLEPRSSTATTNGRSSVAAPSEARARALRPPRRDGRALARRGAAGALPPPRRCAWRACATTRSTACWPGSRPTFGTPTP